MFNYSNPCLSGLGMQTHGCGMVGVLTYYWVELKIKSYTVKTLGSVTICDGLIKHIWNTIIIQKLKSMNVGWSNIEH
jgi:hypothetical protein